MRPGSFQALHSRTSTGRRGWLAALIAGLLATAPAYAAPPPPPPASQDPPPVYAPAPPPPIYFPAPRPDPSPPPPLPLAMRIVYAPFYAAGLILRYGVYYVLVAPFEVLGRTLDYGVEGGVDADPNGAAR